MMASIFTDVQCIQKHSVAVMVLRTYLSKKASFIILLLQVGLVGFSRVTVSVTITVMFSFGTGLPGARVFCGMRIAECCQGVICGKSSAECSAKYPLSLFRIPQLKNSAFPHHSPWRYLLTT